MKEKGKTMPDFETVGTIVACVIILVMLIVVGVLQLRAKTSMNVTVPPRSDVVLLPTDNAEVGQVLTADSAGALKWRAVSDTGMFSSKPDIVQWAVEGKEVLRLEPTGGPAFRLVVMYDGAKRGELLRVEYGSGVRTVSLPNRPPHGWMIGGRR